MNWYCNSLSADADTAPGWRNRTCFGSFPAKLLQFPLVALGSALRATGIVQPTVILQVLSIALNIVLAPFLIFGTGHTWPAFDVIRRIVATFVSLPSIGVTGAALASFIAILIADVLLILYFEKKYQYLRFRLASMRPQLRTWSKMLRIGVPAGAEFVLLFVYILIVSWIIQRFRPGGAGRVRYRCARHAGALPSGGGAKFRRFAGRRTKLRWTQSGPRPARRLIPPSAIHAP